MFTLTEKARCATCLAYLCREVLGGFVVSVADPDFFFAGIALQFKYQWLLEMAFSKTCYSGSLSLSNSNSCYTEIFFFSLFVMLVLY